MIELHCNDVSFLFQSKNRWKRWFFGGFPLFIAGRGWIDYTILHILNIAVKLRTFAFDKIAFSLDLSGFPVISHVVTHIPRLTHTFDIYSGSPHCACIKILPAAMVMMVVIMMTAAAMMMRRAEKWVMMIRTMMVIIITSAASAAKCHENKNKNDEW